jgi:hypothetical protein
MRARRHDNPVVAIVIVGAILLVVVISYFISKTRQRKRTEALERVADDLGLEFSPTGADGLVDELSWCQLFSRGRGKKALNLMRGQGEGRDVSVFDYQYVTGGGKSRRVWNTTVVCLRFDGGQLPWFMLRPERMWDKVVGWFKGSKIDFNTNPEFSRCFLLRSDQEADVRRLFRPAVLQFYEQHPDLSTEGLHNTLLLYRHSKRIEPQAIGQFLADAFEALSLVRGGMQMESRA